MVELEEIEPPLRKKKYRRVYKKGFERRKGEIILKKV
jgi:hypothetical protein